MASLEEFLKTGVLGPVQTGASYAEVIAALGAPEAVSTQKKPQIIRYGPLQITFHCGEDRVDRVLMIALYPRDFGEELPAAARLDTAPLASREKVFSFLAEIGVVPTDFETDPSELVRLPSGVQVVFDEDNVHGVYATTPVPVPPRRQLTLTLSDETMAALKVMAKAQHKRSVAELAASLLTAQADSGTN